MRLLYQKIVARYVINYREDGILHVHVSDAVWNPENTKELFVTIGAIVNYEKVPLLLTYEKFVFPESEEVRYYTVPENACPYFLVVAIVTNSLPLKILGNFFLKFNKPLRTTSLFDKEANAIAWLKIFL